MTRAGVGGGVKFLNSSRRGLPLRTAAASSEAGRRSGISAILTFSWRTARAAGRWQGAGFDRRILGYAE